MPKRRTTPQRPRDVNQLAQRIVAISTGQEPDAAPEPVNAAASKRGIARAAKLSAVARRKIAKKAAAVRWEKHR